MPSLFLFSLFRFALSYSFLGRGVLKTSRGGAVGPWPIAAVPVLRLDFFCASDFFKIVFFFRTLGEGGGGAAAACGRWAPAGLLPFRQRCELCQRPAAVVVCWAPRFLSPCSS